MTLHFVEATLNFKGIYLETGQVVKTEEGAGTYIYIVPKLVLDYGLMVKKRGKIAIII